jgi:hypothetical protein
MSDERDTMAAMALPEDRGGSMVGVDPVELGQQPTQPIQARRASFLQSWRSVRRAAPPDPSRSHLTAKPRSLSGPVPRQQSRL